MRYYYTSTKIVRIKKVILEKVEDVEQLLLLYPGSGSMNWYNNFGKPFETIH